MMELQKKSLEDKKKSLVTGQDPSASRFIVLPTDI
jgi:hypothetical protein